MEAEDSYLDAFEDQDRRALAAEKVAQEERKKAQEERKKNKEALKRIELKQQRAEQAENKIYESIKRMRSAGLPDADICAFLNISPQELEQMRHFDSAQ